MCSCVLFQITFKYRRGIIHFDKTSSICENLFLAKQVDKMVVSWHLADPRLMAIGLSFIVVCYPPRVQGRGGF